jgi:hypothetical protein
MTKEHFRQHILRTLLYYEMFNHPLSAKELYHLFPVNSMTFTSFQQFLSHLVQRGDIMRGRHFIHTPGNEQFCSNRMAGETLGRKRLTIARLMSHIIKRFPFVRAVFVSGDLSKGVATSASDIDYVIVTEPHRLWICRTLLILFKKIFLFNSKKYFCLNYFIDSAHLELDTRTYYSATEIAHLKPLHNLSLYIRYMNANNWILNYFPNFRAFAFLTVYHQNRNSFIQKALEIPFNGRWADKLDKLLMNMMKDVWKRRYPEHDDMTRKMLFKSTEYESRAYGGNFAEKILTTYDLKLRENNLV